MDTSMSVVGAALSVPSKTASPSNAVLQWKKSSAAIPDTVTVNGKTVKLDKKNAVVTEGCITDQNGRGKTN